MLAVEGQAFVTVVIKMTEKSNCRIRRVQMGDPRVSQATIGVQKGRWSVGTRSMRESFEGNVLHVFELRAVQLAWAHR